MLAAAAAAETERRAPNAEKTSIIINFVVGRLRFIDLKFNQYFAPLTAPDFQGTIQRTHRRSDPRVGSGVSLLSGRAMACSQRCLIDLRRLPSLQKTGIS